MAIKCSYRGKRMKLIFIVNEKSGNGKGAKVWRNIQSQLSVPYDVFVTTYEKEAIKIAEQIKTESNHNSTTVLLIGIGGDGTYHEILNGIQGAKHIVLGAVCAGSGNDFKRAYGHFDNAKQIEQFMHQVTALSQDAGEIEVPGQKSNYFINNSGIGFDATVAMAANRSDVKKVFNLLGLGKLSYVYYLIKCLFTFKPFNLDVSTDEQIKSYENVWFVTASNQPYFGGGMKISPSSKTNDGLLELTIVHSLNKYKLLFIFITVFFGKHTQFKEIDVLSSTTFTIHMNDNYDIHADGENLSIETKSGPIKFSAIGSYWKLAKKSD